MDLDLDDGQRAVVERDPGPLRVTGGFGSGKSAALRARAARLRREGRRPLLVHHRDVVALAVEVLRRHGRDVRLGRPAELLAITRSLTDQDPDEAVVAVGAFQASFLGDEELRVHADAAGCLDEAERLIDLTTRYLRIVAARHLVDDGGALVQASLLLRDPDVLAGERARFDELLVDDFQLASFATNRLLTQLAGPGGPIVVAGHEGAAVATDPLASTAHLDRFERRFGAGTVELASSFRRPVAPPELRLLDDGEDMGLAARRALRGLDHGDAVIVHRDGVEEFVGHDAALVVVEDATDGRWPSPRPRRRWFDLEVLHGPDVPDEGERDRRWDLRERRRFAVATTRATERLVVLAHRPVTRFAGDLLR